MDKGRNSMCRGRDKKPKRRKKCRSSCDRQSLTSWSYFFIVTLFYPFFNICCCFFSNQIDCCSSKYNFYIFYIRCKFGFHIFNLQYLASHLNAWYQISKYLMILNTFFCWGRFEKVWDQLMWRSGSRRRPLRSSPGVPYLLPFTCYTSYLPVAVAVLPVDTRLVLLGKTIAHWSVTQLVRCVCSIKQI